MLLSTSTIAQCFLDRTQPNATIQDRTVHIDRLSTEPLEPAFYRELRQAANPDGSGPNDLPVLGPTVSQSFIGLVPASSAGASEPLSNTFGGVQSQEQSSSGPNVVDVITNRGKSRRKTKRSSTAKAQSCRKLQRRPLTPRTEYRIGQSVIPTIAIRQGRSCDMLMRQRSKARQSAQSAARTSASACIIQVGRDVLAAHQWVSMPLNASFRRILTTVTTRPMWK